MRRAGCAVAALLVFVGGEGVAAAAERPDLKLARLVVAPATVGPGGTVRISDTVRNAGARRSKKAEVGYFLSGDARRGGGDDIALSGRRKLKAIKPRRRAKGTRNVRIPANAGPGAYRVIGCADPRRKVKERNERNNCRAAARSVRVVVPPGPFVPIVPPPVPPPAPAPPPPPPPPPGGDIDFPQTPDPLSVTDALETENRVSASMGAIEGTLTATADDGTTYTLTMPEGSLLSPVDVTMTPVASVGGLPLSQGLIGAVELRPHGLMLRKPATLTVDPPAGVSTAGATAFLYHQGGEDFHLYPVKSGLSLSLLHFSTPGFGRGTAADRANVANHPPARPGAQLEQANAISDPAGHMANYYDGVVRNQLQESQNARTGMAQATEHGLAWLRQLQLLGLGESEALAERIRDLEQRIQILRQIMLEEAIKACKRHELEAAVILMGLARQFVLEGGDEDENPMLEEAKKCLNFEARVDSTVTEERTYTGDVSWGSSSGSWQALGTVPIDWMGFNFSAPLTLGAFTYSSAITSDCAENGTTTQRTVHDGQAAAGTAGALLALDLNPREPAPAGQPAADPPQDSLTLMFNSGPRERYRHWSEGCGGTSPSTFGENTYWRQIFASFHDNSTVLKLPIQRSRTPAEVIHTELFADSQPVGNGTTSENTRIELWHTPKS
jgi:hypothetical protein